MLTLVFDTCFNKSYIVLSDNDNILNSEIIHSTDSNYHSVFLIPKIRDILKKNNLQIKDMDAIGVNIGPGSFTGIRAGITIARVLAQQSDTKLVGVSSLQILSKLNKSDKKTIVVTDARKNNVYYAEYIGDDVVQAPYLLEKDNLISKISADCVVISDASISTYLEQNGINHINYENSDDDLGLFLSEITRKMLLNSNEDYNWAKVKPLYIQKPSITKPKELK